VNLVASQVWNWVALTVGLGVAAVGAYLMARWSWRWLVALLVMLGCVLFLVVLPSRYPSSQFLDPDLPGPFLEHFWAWVLAFLLGLSFSAFFLVRAIRAARPASRAEATPSELAGAYPDIEAAWEEILLQLGRAQIDPAGLPAFLILAPGEEGTELLIRSAGLQLFAQAPAAPSAPIHAYATADGVLLGASGASAFGMQGTEGVRRLEALCRLILARWPDCPTVRGVVVLFPISWAGQPDSIKWATYFRDDLRAIQRVLKIRCPVFAVFPEMETVPGFAEFLARMPPALRQGRCGFAVPTSQPFSGDLIQRGLVWMAGWFHGWGLSLMAEDLFNQAGNNHLFSLDNEFRRYRKRLKAVVEAALATPREAEPPLFRGCYFAATGEGAADQAFSAGLLRGPRGRVLADHLVARWTRDAEADDRHYRRLALGVGITGGLLALFAWLFIIVQTGNPWWWAGPIALAVAWVVAVVRIARL
jgi:type VI protein secretion system component VasK